MKTSIARLLLCHGLLLTGFLKAEIRLPSVFSEHMVLMKTEPVPVWGWADPEETVHVTLGEKKAQAVADASGRWKTQLHLQDSGPGPFEMIVEGKNRLVIPDVVVGEVWLASGQSNMELPLQATTEAEAEIAQSANPLLRQFLVKKAGTNEPKDDCEGHWTVAGPATSGAFTAVGYYFGKELQRERKTPVGILHTSHGGTYIEPWTPADVFDRIELFQASTAVLKKSIAEYPVQKAKFVADFTAWLKEHGRTDEPCPDLPHFAGEGVSPAGWTTVALPGKVAVPGFPSAGVFWLRRDIDVSATLARQGFKIMIGPLAGYWQVYWNGKKLTEMTYARMPGKDFSCYFAVPPDQIRAGENTLVLRIYSPTAPLVVPGRALWAGPIDLAGKWLAKVERSFPELPAEVLHSAPQLTYQLPDSLPGSLYNAMIHPLIPYALAGVIWYQGENNVKRANDYRLAFPALIKGWREKWQREDLPFYFCQLCNNLAKQPAPGESGWAELRESQSLALALPHTGQAVTIDLGEAGDLHSRDKKTVGERLYRIAAAQHYHQPVAFSGPVYDTAAIEKGRAHLHFLHAEGGLQARALPATYPIKTLLGETAPLIRNSPHSELEGFAICGADHKWVWAEARIEGGSVWVWSDLVPSPIAVRYAWADNPTCNLYNGAGLPASPFRTDDFPAMTRNSHF